MPDLIWKSDSLYFHGIYVGKIVHLYPFDKDQAACAAFIQTIPTGHLLGSFVTPDEARAALVRAAEIALTRG
jgi:hypothetical protein